MFGRIFFPGLAAGIIAGLFMFVAQQTQIVPMILEAESFESAAPAHNHDGTGATVDHDHGATAGESQAAQWAPADGLERTLYSGLTSVLAAIGFGLVLAGCFAVRGGEMSWRQGVVWGLAGYVSFHLAPAFGLSPELPTMAGDNLFERQVWWLGTVAATAAGLALVAFARPMWLKGAGVLLIVTPHVIGAPHAHVDSDVPAALAAQFAVVTLVVTALFWALLGGLTGYFYRRRTSATA